MQRQVIYRPYIFSYGNKIPSQGPDPVLILLFVAIVLIVGTMVL